MPRARGRALVGAVPRPSPPATSALDRGADRDDVRAGLLALPGIGPWTADYVAMRALGDPDVFLPTDIGVRNALARLGPRPGRRAIAGSRRLAPWRSYALLHLWRTPACRPCDRADGTATQTRRH